MKILRKNTIRIAAAGDLLLCAKPPDYLSGRGLEAVSQEIIDLFSSCDIVFGNLECTLPGEPKVPSEPRVISSRDQITSLSHAGFHVVTLGNNHMFDCLEKGFQAVQDTLSGLKIPGIGAGTNRQEAFKPAVIEAGGTQVVFLGCAAGTTGAKRFATDSGSGIAPMDMMHLKKEIRDLRTQVNHIIVSPHWGTERFRIPSPAQIQQGRAFIDAGASMVLGHHPHVLQGMELYRGCPVVYSLGNFLANPVYWEDGDTMTWSRFERTSCIITADLGPRGVENIRQIPVFDNGETVELDYSGWTEACIKQANDFLEKGVSTNRYKREKFYIELFKPIMDHLHPSELHKIRWSHFRNLLSMIRSR